MSRLEVKELSCITDTKSQSMRQARGSRCSFRGPFTATRRMYGSSHRVNCRFAKSPIGAFASSNGCFVFYSTIVACRMHGFVYAVVTIHAKPYQTVWRLVLLWRCSMSRNNYSVDHHFMLQCCSQCLLCGYLSMHRDKTVLSNLRSARHGCIAHSSTNYPTLANFVTLTIRV